MQCYVLPNNKQGKLLCRSASAREKGGAALCSCAECGGHVTFGWLYCWLIESLAVVMLYYVKARISRSACITLSQTFSISNRTADPISTQHMIDVFHHYLSSPRQRIIAATHPPPLIFCSSPHSQSARPPHPISPAPTHPQTLSNLYLLFPAFLWWPARWTSIRHDDDISLTETTISDVSVSHEQK